MGDFSFPDRGRAVDPNSAPGRASPVSKALFTVGALLLAGAHMTWPQTIDQIGLLLILIASLPWTVPFLREHFRRIEGLGAKLEFVEKQLSDQSRRIDELYLLSIGGNAFNHLRKLASPHGYGSFYVGSALPRELEYLENLGFVRFKEPLQGLDDFLRDFNGKEGTNLSDQVELTEAGKMFVDLREAASRATSKRAGITELTH